MNRLLEEIRQARREGRLPARFTGKDVERAYPGDSSSSYNSFLAKHRVGNPVGAKVFFVRYGTGVYGLVPERD